MFTGPIFSNPIFSNSAFDLNDVFVRVEIVFQNELRADLDIVCVGMKCINFKHKCATWIYKNPMQSLRGGAYVPAVTVCDLKNYVYRKI